jgi:two-component system, OmpR family, KDP operon response regulator KdpE
MECLEMNLAPYCSASGGNLSTTAAINLCAQIRGYCDTPIIILGARRTQHDNLLTLVNPFETERLLAHIRAFLWSSLPDDSMPPFVAADLNIDFERRLVKVRNRKIHLTPKEFELLRYLIAHNGKTVALRDLFDALWGPCCDEQGLNLRVVINQLRRKIEIDPAHPRYILTETSVGYRFQLPPEDEENVAQAQVSV